MCAISFGFMLVLSRMYMLAISFVVFLCYLGWFRQIAISVVFELGYIGCTMLVLSRLAISNKQDLGYLDCYLGWHCRVLSRLVLKCAISVGLIWCYLGWL